MVSDRWTTETEELVARAIYGRRTGTNVDGFTDWDWDNAPLSADARRAWRARAGQILTALADAGLLLAPGGETREEIEGPPEVEDAPSGAVDLMVATCPLDVWDGPYKTTCGRVLGRNGDCLTHWAYRGDPSPVMVVAPWLPVSDGGGA